MCSLVSAEPSDCGCRVVAIWPSGRDPQRFAFDALEAILEDTLGAAVDQAGETLFEGSVEGHE